MRLEPSGRSRAQRGRGGGTTLPGRVLDGAGAAGRRAARRRAAARQRRRLGDERQDDDLRDGGGDPRSGRSRSAATPPARTCCPASRRRSSMAPEAARLPSSACSSATRRHCRRSSAACGRTRSRSATSSATSSTATASSRRSPSAGARWSPRCRPRRRSIACADDPLTADIASAHAGVRDVRDRRSGARAGTARARLGLALLRALRARPTTTRPSGSGISATTAARPAVTRARSSRSPPRRSSSAGSRRSRSISARRSAAAASSSPCPACTTSRTPSRRRASRSRSARRSRTSRDGLARFRPAFGRFQRIALADRAAVMLLIKNPAGANEALATLARGAGDDLHTMVALNDRIADGTDVSWIWDVDWELIAPALGHVVVAGSQGAGHRPAAEVRGGRRLAGSTIEPDIARALDATLRRRRRRRLRVPAADLHRDARAAGHHLRPRSRPTVLGAQPREARPLPAVPRAPLDLRRPRERARAAPALRMARDRARGAPAAPRRSSSTPPRSTSSCSAAARIATSC